jgi:hypothetical protein
MSLFRLPLLPQPHSLLLSPLLRLSQSLLRLYSLCRNPL